MSRSFKGDGLFYACAVFDKIVNFKDSGVKDIETGELLFNTVV